MSKSCFIIQPFDGGEYDKRYKEIFLDAIKSSGFDPYRIDEDSSSSIPIIDIEKRIEQADVCFADISIDNPNVWCEVGLAIAHKKDLCLVCAKGRKLPFDVQHRQVIFYNTTAPSDFAELKSAIEKRLAAVADRQSKMSLIPDAIVNAETHQSELNNFEVAVISVLASELSLDEENISINYLRQAVDKQGYTSLAANAGIRMLVRKDFVSTSRERDIDGDPYTVLTLTGMGWDWIEKNLEKFSVRKGSGGRVERFTQMSASKLDDDIPF